ncbi:MAG: glutamate 5-kinase [Bacteroidales bacterium]|jgi:glutamate 5-kinase|nr:glutamate 5-kinase [Bacteroidales bacterium]
MNYRDNLREKKRIVIKIGTSSLTFPNGRLNFSRIEHMCKVIAQLKQQGKEIVLVSSGSIAVGVSKLGKKKRPDTIPGKQAAAAVGQAVLAKIYRKFFDVHSIYVGQILITYDVIKDDEKRQNAENTFEKLFEIGAVPIVNENDTVATDEIEIGDNDRLSAMVAGICKADLLVMLSDIDGFFDEDPRKNKNAQRVSVVKSVDESIMNSAGQSGSSFGTGGMSTKILAVSICHSYGIDTIIANADKPEILFPILEGEDIGTLFVAPH